MTSLHDLYVAGVRAKMDMIPGSVTYILWFTPTAPDANIRRFSCGNSAVRRNAQMMRKQRVIERRNERYHAWLEKRKNSGDVRRVYRRQRGVEKGGAYKDG